MVSLQDLQPQEVLRWFYALAAIPHGSGNTKAVSDFCVKFAEERGLEHYQDGLNNVIIIAPAAPGYENAPAVILQGHLDMVCAKAPGCEKDMTTEGLDLATDGAWLYAEGTTLGADDGIAVAMALAVLDDPSLPRPRIEAVFTVDEEIGMLGAAGLDTSPLQGRTVINIDSEAEGIFTVGCAGGVRTELHLSLEQERIDAALYTLSVSGLTGGHSGNEIHRGRANANVLMGRALSALSKITPVQLVSVNGGTADNVIPNTCIAVFAASPDAANALQETASGLEVSLKAEYAAADPALCVTLTAAPEQTLTAASADASRQLIDLLCACPNGVQAMSQDIPGLVETSLNLGILSLSEGNARLCFLIRSSRAIGKESLKAQLASLAAAYSASVSYGGDYPPWEYRKDSPLRERMTEIYRRQYGSDPRIEVIHAGLECGVLASQLPGMDCVSIGPDLPDIHTPAERMDLAGTQRVWNFVKEILKESK